MLDLKVLIIFCISLLSKETYGQLGFCQGNSGDPIFMETFGTGTNYGPQLPAGTTTYNFNGTSGPQDGQYTIGRNTFSYGWNLPSDHTGDTNGKALIVNASFTAGEFYKIAINGLCENTTYEFSSWLINILPNSGCGGNGIPVNVQFEIWDNTDTNLLASGDTGNIFSSSTPTWAQYGLVFQTVVGQTSVILKMKNNGVGGCGNDLAIDDIVFRTCGDSIDVNDGTSNNSITLCSSQTPYSETITALPDNVVFSNHFYQWQTSTDGINWIDIIGETNASLSISAITMTSYYRAKVAEYASNLNNADCLTFSDVYEIIINQAPPPPTTECWETATFNDTSCSWIVTGNQPTQPTGLECWQTATFNTTICDWEVTGSQPQQPTTECWETTVFNTTTCVWDISGTQPVQPTIECWQITVFDTTICDWEVTGTQPTEPMGLECWQTAVFDTEFCTWEVIGVQPEQPTIECWQTTSFSTTSCSWEITGTQPNAPTNLECWQTANFNEANCSWEVLGSQPIEPTDLECWETAVFNEELCTWQISGTQPIDYREEFLFLCEGSTLELVASSTINSANYNWSSGEMASSITIDSAGVYEVEITDDCLTDIITYNVTLIETPIIEAIETNGSSITINLVNSGNYLYSIDGIDYQTSNVFSNVLSGSYTIFVKSNICETVVEQDYFHFFIQKFITPNGDGNNDFFSLNITQYFTASEVYIYDRYGKLLFSSINRNVNWNGTFNGNNLPTSDYWYRIILDGQTFLGHFTLKR